MGPPTVAGLGQCRVDAANVRTDRRSLALRSSRAPAGRASFDDHVPRQSCVHDPVLRLDGWCDDALVSETPRRSIRFVRALASLAPLLVAGCSVAEAQQLAPRPDGLRAFRVSACPSRQPQTRDRCTVASRGGTTACAYLPVVCNCRGRSASDARWSCMHTGANRGPLPPPELSEARV